MKTFKEITSVIDLLNYKGVIAKERGQTFFIVESGSQFKHITRLLYSECSTVKIAGKGEPIRIDVYYSTTNNLTGKGVNTYYFYPEICQTDEFADVYYINYLLHKQGYEICTIGEPYFVRFYSYVKDQITEREKTSTASFTKKNKTQQILNVFYFDKDERVQKTKTLTTDNFSIIKMKDNGYNLVKK